MFTKFLQWISMIILVVFLGGCAKYKPQILSPMSDGFASNEYIVIEVKDTDQIGQLYEAVQEKDSKGNIIPLLWRPTSLLLFPQSTDFNKVKETKIEQTRRAVETVNKSGKFTATGIGNLQAENESAYKYQSKSDLAMRLEVQNLKYNPSAKRYMTEKLAKNSNYKFAYLSAIYKGTAFVEILAKVNNSGAGGYAAFQLEGQYYTSSDQALVTSGSIIFQLLPIQKDELENGVSLTGETRLSELSNSEIKTILKNRPDIMKSMIEGTAAWE